MNHFSNMIVLWLFLAHKKTLNWTMLYYILSTDPMNHECVPAFFRDSFNLQTHKRCGPIPKS